MEWRERAVTMYHAAIALLIVGSAADSLTTWRALSGGKAREANPIMRWLLERIGLVPMVLLRFALGCALAAAVWAMPELSLIGLVFGMIYCLVAFRNWGKAQ